MKRLLLTLSIVLTMAVLCCASAYADTLTTNGGAKIDCADLEYCVQDEDAPVVYYLSDISPQSLVKIYEAMEWSGKDPVAVKLSTGEPPMSNYLKPELIEDLVKAVDGTIVECNTAYGGSRSSTMRQQMGNGSMGGSYDLSTYLIDENGVIVKAFGAVKAKDNPAQMLESLG